MIRIDEIYNNTFWPWIQKKLPGTRMLFCDPPGNSDPEHLFTFGNSNILETSYVFFHDQEPVDSKLFYELFKSAEQIGSEGLGWLQENGRWKEFPIHTRPGHIVVSERGECVEALCEQYGWRSHYYFYHGWACLDWFRGYDKTFLIDRAEQRRPNKTFLSPNRIVGGYRDHRVIFLYHVFKTQMQHNHISAPKICPYEMVDISTIAKKYYNTYPDIVQVLNDENLPKLFGGESVQQMTSCWLTNFEEAADSLFYVPTETVYFGRRTHLTEKTFKAIALEMPFVLVATAGSLEYLRSYGFKTFDHVFDESYDCETNDFLRLEKVSKLLKDIDSLSLKERLQIHRACLPIVQHNYNHFYKGTFADILWKEFVGMLENIRV